MSDAINAAALERLGAADPIWVDVALAREYVPHLNQGMALCHAGPPIAWADMAAPMRGAIVASFLFEGWATSPDEAVALMDTGGVALRPNNDSGAIGPMAGLLSPSSPVFVVRERTTGITTVTGLVEGMNPAHRFGAFHDASVERLRWLRDVLAPVLKEVVRETGGVELIPVMTQAIQMGDELHQRNLAASALLHKQLLPVFGRMTMNDTARAAVFDYLGNGNIQYFLNLAMAACSVSLRTIEGTPGSSLVTVMARNGVELGIKVAGLGDQWFTGPAGVVKGAYFPGFSAADANADLGDSAITETFGVGFHALAGAPLAWSLVGVSSAAQARTGLEAVRRICAGVSPRFIQPHVDGQGLPCGIDVFRVEELAQPPIIATAIAHREFGNGHMIGCGLVPAPLQPFLAAAEALRKRTTGSHAVTSSAAQSP